MLSGWYRGERIGSGTNTWSLSEDLRAGKITQDEFHEAESCMHRSHGHCMTMGTASTMASMVEALGVGLPGNAAYPAVDARRNVIARMAGRRIVEMVKQDVTLSKILTREAFENAIRVNAAIGGSTNAVIHLIAHRAAHRREARPRGLGQVRPRRAHAREPHAQRQVPDGGLLLRGRACRS